MCLLVSTRWSRGIPASGRPSKRRLRFLPKERHRPISCSSLPKAAAALTKSKKTLISARIRSARRWIFGRPWKYKNRKEQGEPREGRQVTPVANRHGARPDRERRSGIKL